MKLRSGDMLVMDYGYDALKLQIIGRDDVPRIEKEGRGWSDGATAILKGADAAEFLDALGNTSGEYEIGDIGLSVKVEYDVRPVSGIASPVLVLSAKDVSAKVVSVRLTWPERALLVCAFRGFAWKLFM